MTDQDTGDVSQVDPLLKQITMPVGQFTAHGAYDGNPIYDAVTSYNVGAMVVIPPRERSGKVGRQTLPSTRPPYRGNHHKRSAEMASRGILQQTASGRDRDRPIQGHHLEKVEGAVVRHSADRGRHRLHRLQSHAGMRTPEIRPSIWNHLISDGNQTIISKAHNPSTNANRVLRLPQSVRRPHFTTGCSGGGLLRSPAL